MKSTCLVFIFISLIAASCDLMTDPHAKQSGGNMWIDEDSPAVKSRLQVQNIPIRLKNTYGSDRDKEHKWVHVAEVEAPASIEGYKLSATCAVIRGDYGFVSWHLNQGPEDYSGLLEVYDLTDPENPKIRSSIFSADHDFNHIYVDKEMTENKLKLWATGSENLKAKNLKSPAGIIEFELEDMRFAETMVRRYDLPAFSGNCAVTVDGCVLGVSGRTDGGLMRINPAELDTSIEFTANGLKYIDVNDRFLAVLKQGRPSSKLRVYERDHLDFSNPIRTMNVGPITPENGKNVVHLNDSLAYIAAGKYGVKVFDISQSMNLPRYTYITPLPGASNGVCTDEDYIYIANGSSGLHILDRYDYFFKGNFSYQGSANFVAAGNDFVFVANGVGGLKILRKV